MRPGALWLEALALLPLAGAPLLAHPAYRRFSAPSRLVLSAGTGAVLVSFAMTLFALIGARWHVGALTLAAALLALALRGLLAPVSASPPSPPGRDPRIGVAAARTIACVAVAAAFAATAAGAAGSNDLIFFWGPKAQRFAAVRTIDAGFLVSPLNGHMHPPYPPLVTNLYAFASMAAGRFAWGAATFTFPLLLAALAAALPGVLRGAAQRGVVAANSALLVSALAYLGIVQNIGGNAEMPLLFFEILGIALLLSPAASEIPGQLLAGLFLAGAATVKVEGLPFSLAAAILFLLVREDRATSNWKTGLLLLSPTVAALGAWFAFGASRNAFHKYESYGRLLELHPDHLGAILRAIGGSFWSTGYALPFLVPLAAFLLQTRWSRPMLLPLGVAAALTGFFLFTYLHLASDPRQWILWSAGRIFSPVPALLSVAAACGRAEKTP